MPDTNNEIFQIDRFQMKICNDWGETQQEYVPLRGEPIYITELPYASMPNVRTPIFIIGNGINSLVELINNGYYYINNRTLDNKIPKITIGTGEPSGGINGDIYIQVEGNA